jgi:hypothetical protein
MAMQKGARVRRCEGATVRGALLLVVLASWVVDAGAQARRGGAPQPATTTEPAVIECPSMLGDGVKTRRSFCDVMIGRDPVAGVIVKLPPHTGPVTLTFDLHNRHTYSEELIKTKRAYRHYTATIGVLTADNTLLTRAVVQNEFRSPVDLLDRVSGGAGPGGVKAVAPTGSESISVAIPAAEQTVSILGEKLSVVGPDGVDNFSAPGRPIAVISNVQVQYRPAPARRTPARR